MFIIPKQFAGIKRYGEILSVLDKHGLGRALEKLGLKKKNLLGLLLPERKLSPVELRLAFEELGGGFLHLALFLSSRDGIIPRAYASELSKIDLPKYTPEKDEIIHIIENELSAPFSKVFKSINEAPVANLLTGTLFEAKLKDGKEAMVRLLAPGSEAAVKQDLEMMDYLSRIIEAKLAPKSFDAEKIVAEFREVALNAHDYLVEAGNIKLFSHHSNAAHPDIVGPELVGSLSRKRMLVTRKINGIRLSKIEESPGSMPQAEKARIASELSKAMLSAAFNHGRYHPSPRLRNIFVLKKKIYLVGFGAIAKLDDSERRSAAALVASLMNLDINAAAFILKGVCGSKRGAPVDLDALKIKLSIALQKYYEAPLSRLDIGGMLSVSISAARENGLQIPKGLGLLSHMIVILQDSCIKLDPCFSITREMTPFVERASGKKVRPDLFEKILPSEKSGVAEDPVPGFSVQTATYKRAEAVDEMHREFKDLSKEVHHEGKKLVIGFTTLLLVIAGLLLRRAGIEMYFWFIFIAGALAAAFVATLISEFIFLRRKR